MKKLSLYLLTSLLLSSCASTYQEIGSLNILSDRKVDPNGHYTKLVAAAGSSKKELKKSSSTNIEDAIDQVLDQVPGAKYMTNVKIYVVRGEYIAVSGDVWGQPAVNTSSSDKTEDTNTRKASIKKANTINNKVADTVNSFDRGTESIAQ